MLKFLHTVTAALEIGAGLGLLCCPALVVHFLAGAPLEGPAALTVARVGGAGLLSLGIACWLARNDAQSGAARGLVAGMLVYNIGAVVVLAYAGLGYGLHGIALWPAIILHAAMAAWCGASLLKFRGRHLPPSTS